MSKRKPSWNTIARNRISKAASFGGGDGQFAFVTPCRIVYYTLWQRRDEAEKRKPRSIRQDVEGSANRGRITSLIS